MTNGIKIAIRQYRVIRCIVIGLFFIFSGCSSLIHPVNKAPSKTQDKLVQDRVQHKLQDSSLVSSPFLPALTSASRSQITAIPTTTDTIDPVQKSGQNAEVGAIDTNTLVHLSLPDEISLTLIMHKNNTISATLNDWAHTAHWHVLWRLNQDWQVPVSLEYHGTFESCAVKVLQSLVQNGVHIQAILYQGNKVLVINGVGDTDNQGTWDQTDDSASGSLQ